MSWKRKEQFTGVSFRDNFTGAGIEMAGQGHLSKLWQGLCTEEEAWRPAGDKCIYTDSFSTPGVLYAVSDYIHHKLTPKQVEDYHKCYVPDPWYPTETHHSPHPTEAHIVAHNGVVDHVCEDCGQVATIMVRESEEDGGHLTAGCNSCGYGGGSSQIYALIGDDPLNPTPSWVSAAMQDTGVSIQKGLGSGESNRHGRGDDEDE